MLSDKQPCTCSNTEIHFAAEKLVDALERGSHLNVNKIPIIHNFTCVPAPTHSPPVPHSPSSFLFILLMLSLVTSQFTAGLDQIACAL